MSKDDLPTPKRRNRTMNIADVLSGALDPVLKKRGFASRDILLHWPAMAPKPYDEVAIPDKLTWPRGEKSAEGATLLLRCIPGHALAIAHEGPRIAAAINRYFGYVLVANVRLSAEPAPAVRAKVGAQVADVEDEALREALRTLGHALSGRIEP